MLRISLNSVPKALLVKRLRLIDISGTALEKSLRDLPIEKKAVKWVCTRFAAFVL